jgi:AcrR family transcriptional regulator
MTESQIEMTPRQRAVRAEDKLERRQALLDVAWRLFQSIPYGAITVSQIAEEAGLAKGTVYLYFKTKEEAFLAVTQQQLGKWFEELDARLSKLGRAGATRVARAITTSLNKRPALLRLLAMLHTTLEQNADVEAVRGFKNFLREHLGQAGAAIESCLPFLSKGQGAHALLQLYALVIGMQHLTHPAPVARRVIEEDKLREFDLRFDREFSAAAEALLRGLVTGR